MMQPIIDSHTHYGGWFFPIRMTNVEDFKRLMKLFNVEAAVASSSKAIVYDLAEGNRELSQVLDPSEGLYGYVTVNPNYLELSKIEIQNYLERSEFKGIKFHTSYTGVPLGSEKFVRLVEYAEPYEKPFLLHTYSQADVIDIRALAGRFTGLRFIMGHMGGTDASMTGANWKLAISVASELSNVYLETCMTKLEAGKIEEAIDRAGAHRILYGSDMTLINPAHIIGMIESAEIGEGDKAKILYWNAKELFSL